MCSISWSTASQMGWVDRAGTRGQRTDRALLWRVSWPHLQSAKGRANRGIIKIETTIEGVSLGNKDRTQLALVHSFKQAVTWGFCYYVRDCRSLASSPGTRKHDPMAPTASRTVGSKFLPILWTSSGLEAGVGPAWASNLTPGSPGA